MLPGSWHRDFLEEIDEVFGTDAVHDQAGTARGAHETLSGSEYNPISRTNYRPVEGGRHIFSDERHRGIPSNPTGRQLGVPPSKRWRTGRERLGGLPITSPSIHTRRSIEQKRVDVVH